MKFVLIFITAAISHGPANVGNAPFLARFDTVAQCETMRKTLVDPSELADHTRGWQCIPEIQKYDAGATPAKPTPTKEGAAACMRWSHEAYEASRDDPSFAACLALYPHEMSEQVRRDVTSVGAASAPYHKPPWPGPLPTPWSGKNFRNRCVLWHWYDAKPINNSDWADEDMACGSLWRREHHCSERPDQNGC
jgi:hypothetical protein